MPALLALAGAAWPAGRALPAERSAPATAENAGAFLVGQILHVAHPTTVRTRGSGHISVDLPRGRAVVLVELRSDAAVLAPAPPDGEMLRAYGVRRTPRYTAGRAQLLSDFLPAAAWQKARRDGVGRLRERWSALTQDQAERIFHGEPWVGMTEEQAEEAVGAVVLARGPVAGQDGATVWTVGRRPRPAELRIFTEARERGPHPRTFEEFLKGKARATLTFQDGVLASIDPPTGVTPGLNWP